MSRVENVPSILDTADPSPGHHAALRWSGHNLSTISSAYRTLVTPPTEYVTRVSTVTVWSSVLTVTGQWAEAEDTCSPGQPHQSARMERLKNLHTLHHTIHVTRYMLHVTCYTLHDTSHCFLFCCGVESSLTSKHSVSYLYSSFIQLR